MEPLLTVEGLTKRYGRRLACDGIGFSLDPGEVLAVVEPAIPVADQTTIAERSGDLGQQIATAEARLARARNLAASGAGTRVSVIDTEIELEGLRRRRALLAQNRVAREVIRAPADVEAPLTVRNLTEPLVWLGTIV